MRPAADGAAEWVVFGIDCHHGPRPRDPGVALVVMAGGYLVYIDDETPHLVRVVCPAGYSPCPVAIAPAELAKIVRALPQGKESVEHALVRIAGAKSWEELRARLAGKE